MYKVLARLEEAGRCRRGYFIEHLGAAQFAVPATVDRLRSYSEDTQLAKPEPVALALAATDPANPYGAALPWPALNVEAGSGPPARAEGGRAGGAGRRRAGALRGTRRQDPAGLQRGRTRPGRRRRRPGGRGDARRRGQTHHGKGQRPRHPGHPGGSRPGPGRRLLHPEGTEDPCLRAIPSGAPPHQLHAALAGQTLLASDFRVPRFATLNLAGWTVQEVVPRGKHLLMRAASGPARASRLTIHSHLKMEGTWQVYPPGGRWRKPGFTARCVLRTAAADAVGFSLGILEVVKTAKRTRSWASGPGPAGPGLGPGRGRTPRGGGARRPDRRGPAGPAQPGRHRQHLPLRGVLPVRHPPGVARLRRGGSARHDRGRQAAARGQPGTRPPDHSAQRRAAFRWAGRPGGPATGSTGASTSRACTAGRPSAAACWARRQARRDRRELGGPGHRGAGHLLLSHMPAAARAG